METMKLLTFLTSVCLLTLMAVDRICSISFIEVGPYNLDDHRCGPYHTAYMDILG